MIDAPKYEMNLLVSTKQLAQKILIMLKLNHHTVNLCK